MTRRRITTKLQTEILAAYQAGVPGHEIARRYGVSESYAYHVLRTRGLKTRHKSRLGRLWERARTMGAIG